MMYWYGCSAGGINSSGGLQWHVSVVAQSNESSQIKPDVMVDQKEGNNGNIHTMVMRSQTSSLRPFNIRNKIIIMRSNRRYSSGWKKKTENKLNTHRRLSVPIENTGTQGVGA